SWPWPRWATRSKSASATAGLASAAGKPPTSAYRPVDDTSSRSPTRRSPLMSPAAVRVALVGNPNAGKSTLFNALSGLRQRVGNYPGVTVEMKTGRATLGQVEFDLIDLPGTYSLAARSPDEMVAVDLLLGQCPGEARPDVILAIVDA